MLSAPGVIITTELPSASASPELVCEVLLQEPTRFLFPSLEDGFERLGSLDQESHRNYRTNKGLLLVRECFIKSLSQQKPKTVVWTPPTFVYNWPQVNLTGNSNPPQYHLPVLWTHWDAKVWWQSTANERQVFFFFFFSCPSWKWKMRKQFQYAGSYQCISWSCESLWHTHWLIKACEVSQT